MVKTDKWLCYSRVNKAYRTSEGILPVLLGFLVRIQSFNELKYKLKSKDFNRIISRKVKLPQIDTIREILKRIDLSGLEALTSRVVNKAKENKVFRNGKIHNTHNAVFMSLVGSHPRLTIDFELY